MPGSFDFLHLKRHTAGSSNELSFDVLDAARTELDSKSGKSTRKTKMPTSSKGSYHGVAGTSTLSAVPEVERRKRERRRHVVRLRLLVTVLVVALVGVLVFVGYNFFKSRVDFSDRFSSLVADITEIDEDLTIIDGIMEDPLSSDNVEARSEMQPKLKMIEEKIDDALEKAQKTTPFTVGNEDIVAVTQANEALEGRKAMLAAASNALDLAGKYDEELKSSRSAWNDVVDADQLVREATAASNRATTDATTEAAKELTQQALDELKSVRQTLEGMTYRHAKLDLQQQLDYLKKRIEALEYAIKTSDYLIAGDREAAAISNEAYNAADQEAAQLALSLPLMLDDQILSAFEQEMEPLMSEYQQARQVVVQADANVRSYLNS